MTEQGHGAAAEKVPLVAPLKLKGHPQQMEAQSPQMHHDQKCRVSGHGVVAEKAPPPLDTGLLHHPGKALANWVKLQGFLGGFWFGKLPALPMSKMRACFI